MLNQFNDIVVGGKGIPSKWKMTRLMVMFKKGNAKFSSNCRPIAITPILHKLFSRMLCERIQTTLMSQQSSDQAVPCWLQHRRPFVDSDIDDGTVQ